MNGHHWHGEGWHEGWGWAGPVVMLLVWLLLATAVFALLRSTGVIGRGRNRAAVEAAGPTVAASATEEAERILHERFARGEIDEADYTRRHELLKERSGIAPS